MPHQRERNAIQCPSRTLQPHHYRFAVRIAYDGSDYHGFQSQLSSSSSSTSTTTTTSNRNTIQDQIELRLSNLLRRQVRILGWGRTDAGVHATGAIFTVDLSAMDMRRLSAGVVVSSSKSNSREDEEEATRSKKEERKRMKKLAKMRWKEQSRKEQPSSNKEEEENGIHEPKTNDKDDTTTNTCMDTYKESAATRTTTSDDECIRIQIQASAKVIFSTLRLFSDRPGSITAQSVTPIPTGLNFDPRFSCKWKRYVYYVSHISYGNSSGGEGYGYGNGYGFSQTWCLNPFLTRYAWQIDRELDVKKGTDNDTYSGKLMQAVVLLNGTHNFGWLSDMEQGEERDPVRTIRLDVEEISSSGRSHDGAEEGIRGGGVGILPLGIIHHSSSTTTTMGSSLAPPRNQMIKISVVCDFFLYKMVRRIVGILVAVGTGQVDVDKLEACVKFHDKQFKVSDGDGESKEVISNNFVIPNGLLQTAPANGLCLEHVEYDFLV